MKPETKKKKKKKNDLIELERKSWKASVQRWGVNEETAKNRKE